MPTLHDLWSKWRRDQASDVAGMVTFQGVLALFPFLIFLVALGSLWLDPARASDLVAQLTRIAPGPVGQVVADRLKAIGSSRSPGLLTASGAIAVWSASGGARALIRALNTIYGVQEHRPLWKVHGLALATTLVTAGLALTAGVVAVAAPSLAGHLGRRAGSAIVWLRLPAAGLLMMLLLAFVYSYLPDVDQKFRLVTPGAVAGVVLWLVASWGFSLYVRNVGRYEVTYGALGGIVALLVWMWISAQMLLLGAVINSVTSSRRRAWGPAAARP